MTIRFGTTPLRFKRTTGSRFAVALSRLAWQAAEKGIQGLGVEEFGPDLVR
ncbi:hypothetical protein [Poseidonocella sp. HB161398]|uniref:hypothetical protein n=1 Tax=Poseidonocella sp. HB161398 TaxID=2320855 RepID=UPI0014862BB9|nr:hypothetical protein [Poseidonocella sp. HB161398]